MTAPTLPPGIRAPICDAFNHVGNETELGMLWSGGSRLAGRRDAARVCASDSLVRLAVGYLLLCQLQAFSIVDRVFYGEWLGKPGDSFTKTIVFLQISISIVLFFRGSQYWSSVKRGGILSIVLAIFVLSSAAWSVNSGATLRGGVQYLVLIIGAIGVVGNLEGDDFMDLLAWVCFLSATASLVLLVVSPANVGGGDDFRGVFSQKNLAGQAMAMGALASLHGLWVRKRSRLFNFIMFSVIAFVAFKSESVTSWSAIFVFCSLRMAISLLQKTGTFRNIAIAVFIVLLPIVLVLVLVAVFNWNSLLETLGKDPTLTGRTDIWGDLIIDIYRRLWLGWGYGAFWSTDNPEAWRLANTWHWFAPEAHNGILEILLSVGLIGAAFFIYLWGRTLLLSLRCMRTSESAIGITGFFICVGTIVFGVSETVLLYPGALSAVFFITGFSCERALTTARRRRRRKSAAPPFKARGCG